MCDQSTVCNLHALARTAQLERIIKIEKDIEWLKASFTYLYIWNAIDYFIIILSYHYNFIIIFHYYFIILLSLFIIIILFSYHYSLLFYY